MKSRDAVIRLKRFEVEEKRRKVADIEAMIGDFNHMAVDLDRQIAIEQERAGVSDVNHYAYPTFAKAAIQRRNNLAASAADLAAKLAAARGDFDEACEELKKIEHLEERDAERLRLEQARSGPAELEEVGVHRVAS
jgi:flagellar export protein FliJ